MPVCVCVVQLQNQDSVKTLLKRTEKELNVRVSDALRKQEDPLQRQRLLVEEERLKYLNEEEFIIQQLHDLEKSVEDIQKGSSVNHKLVTVQELEEKASLLRKLGETLTELKNQFPSLQSKMRVVLRVEVEAVKFLKEEPHRLDALLKRCKSVTDTLTTMRRQVNEGVWKKQEDFPKHSSEDFRKSSDFDMPTSPPLNLSDLRGSSSLSNWSPHSSHSHSHSHGHAHSHPSSGPHRDNHPPVPHKGRALEELANRAAADKAVSVEVRLAAERDWEEKRASLTQYSAQDINRLLEETQAELMKAIPDLDFAAKQINKPSSNTPSQSQTPQSGGGTPEHRPTKPQHVAHKLSGKEPGSRRGSDAEQLTVTRYRTEKPSKSPPPPPPRRSFPSSPAGLITRSGEILIPGKSMKSEAEEAEAQKPHVKLRRTVSENPRPASTPPTIASGDKEEGEEDNIAAELELFQRAPLRLSHPPPLSLPSAPRSRTSVPPSSLDLWPPGAPCTKLSRASLDCSGLQWKQGSSECTASILASHSQAQSMALPGSSFSPVPRIVLTECVSVSPSPSEGFVRDLTQDHQMSPTVGQSQSKTAPPQTVPKMQQVSKGKDPVSQPQRKPSRRGELRILESFEKKEEREEREELSLVLTELGVMVMSPSEAQKLSRTWGEALQTLTIPPQPSEGSTETRLCGAPLLVLFRETVTVREAYRKLQLLLGREEDTGSSKVVPKPRARSSHSSLSSSPSTLGSKITLSPEQQDSLREALRRGVETGARNLTLPHSTGTKSILATLPEPSQDSAEAAVKPKGSAGCEESQAREEQGLNPWNQGEDIRSSTYRRLDSLDETIRELENTLLELSGHPTTVHLSPPTPPTDTALPEAPDPAQTPGTSTPETKKPPVPPKPKPCYTPATMTKGGNSSSAVGKVHSSAASRLKHLQQSSTEKTKTGKREDFLKGQQQAHGNSSSSIEPLLSGTKAASFSGRLSSSSSASTVFAPGLRKYPQEGALSSLTASSSQAKALLASLSASSLSAEALLLSSTFRQHRLLREQQRASSLPLPNGRSSNSTTTSTTTSSSSSSTSPTSTTSTPSSSPSSPTALTSLNLSSVGLKPSGRSLQYSGSNSYKERGSKTLPKPVSLSNSQ
ncbi:sickle tail protein homolog [Salvelinus fontinalis]|uniref:sickle tail protein homolog n=1 Tax=Salvelinus fontinalis TaxID=8038 RepID=UPI002485BA16|nr:sickle tail protein homolog [Salvelinus fontinalis]